MQEEVDAPEPEAEEPLLLPLLASEGAPLLPALLLSVEPALPAQGVGCVKKEASAVVPAGSFQ